MLEDFINNYEKKYIPSWINYLDEGMSLWLNQYCQGQHPSGNKYCFIADGNQGNPVMWCINFQEGKDLPKDQSYNPQLPNHTKALMLYTTKPI